MALPFTEWSREEKDEYARKRMEEMKLKNERYKERHAEVEQDRLKAELKNSSITSGKIQKKEKEREVIIPKKSEREWDKGKRNVDTEDWSSKRSRDYDFSSRGSRRNYTERRGTKREEWRREQPSPNIGRDRQSKHDFSSRFHKNESTQQGSYIIRNENRDNYIGRPRFKGGKFRGSGYKSYGNLKLDEATKKIFDEMDSASPYYSDQEIDRTKHDRLIWCDSDINEVQHKQIRVEKWVKSINSSQTWVDENELTKTREYSPQNRRKDHHDKFRKCLREDLTDMKDRMVKIQTSKECNYPRNKGKYEQKYNQNMHTNMRGYGNKIPNEDRGYSFSEARSERNTRRKNLNDRNRQRRESEMSDRSSSNKESDWGKNRYNRAASDTDDRSAIWENEECEYVQERKRREKEAMEGNYGKDKVNKSMSLKLTENQDDKKVSHTVFEQPKCTKRNYDKGKNLSKNLSSSDYENSEYKNRSPRKPNLRKSTSRSHGQNKSYKSKTESKFGSRGWFDDNYRGKSQNDNSRSHQKEKKSLTKTASPNFPESSENLESNIPISGSWSDYEQADIPCKQWIDDENQVNVDASKQNHTDNITCSFENESNIPVSGSWSDYEQPEIPCKQRIGDENQIIVGVDKQNSADKAACSFENKSETNQNSNQNQIKKSGIEYETCGRLKRSHEYQANTDWADYVVSEDTEECLSEDSAEKNDEVLIMEPLPDICPKVKSASFENSNSQDINFRFSKLQVKCSPASESSDTCFKTKRIVSLTGSCDSYSSENATKVQTADKKTLPIDTLGNSEQQNCRRVIYSEEFQKPDINRDDKKNLLHTYDPDAKESKDNKSICEASSSNKKEISSHSFEKSAMQGMSGDTMDLSDDGDWLTVSDEDDDDEEEEDTDNDLGAWQ